MIFFCLLEFYIIFKVFSVLGTITAISGTAVPDRTQEAQRGAQIGQSITSVLLYGLGLWVAYRYNETVNLESLTIVIKLDLIDGKQWEEFIRKTKIIKFNFQFILSEKINFSQNKAILLDSFRLAFWLKEKHWCINYTKDRYPPLSTVPSNDEQRIFYSRYIEHLFLDFNKPIDDLPNYRFIHVNSLYLSGLTLPSIDNIMSIVDLNQIKELNMSHIKNISIGEIHLLLEHIPNLNHLIFKNFIPLFKPPSHIYSFTIEE
ncbi:unnamed protein product [Rotaria sp. Silwood1]|nr:unnamed protein product [Rotaria sp. Silwood1]CAF1668306.1 unnamed protein product [Rotaria sp. Silwood1]